MGAEGARQIVATTEEFSRMYLDLLKKAVDDTFRIQCRRKVKQGTSSILSPDSKAVVDIAAVIAVIDRDISGVLALCFSERVFLDVMEGMMGEKFDVISEELEDGAGELLNIIFGHAKKTLNDQGFEIEKAIPTVVRGSQVRVSYLTPSPTTMVPFSIDGGSFHIQIGFEAGDG